MKTKVVAIPTDTEGRLALAQTATNAFVAHPGAVTTPGLPEMIAANRGAVHQALNAVGDQHTRLAAEREARRQARKKLRKQTRAYMSFLRALLGGRWTPEWGAFHMRPGKLKTPATVDDQLAFIYQVGLYLEAHPELENAALKFTAADAMALHKEMTDARSAVLEAEMELKLRNDAVECADGSLADTLMLLRTALRPLGPENPMWAAFGFRIPANPRTPEKVTGVEVTTRGPGVTHVRWNPAQRAVYYRVFAKGAGPEDTMEQVARVEGTTEATLTDLVAGMTYTIVVRAVNEGGEGVGSNPVDFTA